MAENEEFAFVMEQSNSLFGNSFSSEHSSHCAEQTVKISSQKLKGFLSYDGRGTKNYQIEKNVFKV